MMYTPGLIKRPDDYQLGFDCRDMEQRDGVFPSDIDLTYELDGFFFPFFESKKSGCGEKLSAGQRKYFENLITMCHNASKIDNRYLGVVIVFEYESLVDGKYIPVSTGKVTQVYDSINLKWIKPKKYITVKDVENFYKLKYYKRLGCKTEDEYLEFYYDTKKKKEENKKKRAVIIYKNSKIGKK